MAFKASHSSKVKLSRTKKTKEDAGGEGLSTAEPVVIPAVSVEDLVGSPVVAPDAPPVSREASIVSIDSFVAPPENQNSAADNGMSERSEPQPSRTGDQSQSGAGGYRDRPRAGYDSPRSGEAPRGNSYGPPRQYGNYRRGPATGRQGFTPQGPAGGWGQGRRFQDPRPAAGGYRRTEWPSTGELPIHTQDVNVPTETVRGILDVMPEGHGFLRPKFTPSDRDVYISQSQIRRFLLRNGDMVEGQARQPKDNERFWGLLKVEKINEQIAESVQSRPRFDDLTAIYPDRQLKLESGQLPLSTRIIDLVAPVGFGQRALIVSPPKAGKTTILKELATGIAANYPNVHLMAALIGERPEEVTDLTRNIKGEVLASNFDESPQEQTRVAEVALDRAKRLVEMGKDVVILLDSITRLARAYNLVVNPSGRTLSGGFDPAALYPAKKFLGAARCVELTPPSTEVPIVLTEPAVAPPSGGSLTVIGTALVETGSRMDDLIYEEFKGTGNMELHLSRNLQERRVFPAIDVGKSGTRHDELLLGDEKMKKVTTLRHMLSLLSDEERTMMLVDRLGKTKSNDEFLESLSQGS